jgi:hypothetical protein
MLGVVLAGAFIGLFGKVVIASGLDIPVWLVMACGAGGAVSGWLLFGAITVEASLRVATLECCQCLCCRGRHPRLPSLPRR